MLKYLHLYFIFKYGQVVHWYGQVVFLKPIVRGQVYIFEILPPLVGGIIPEKFYQIYPRGGDVVKQHWWWRKTDEGRLIGRRFLLILIVSHHEVHEHHLHRPHLRTILLLLWDKFSLFLTNSLDEEKRKVGRWMPAMAVSYFIFTP